jgi:hypothetical protein
MSKKVRFGLILLAVLSVGLLASHPTQVVEYPKDLIIVRTKATWDEKSKNKATAKAYARCRWDGLESNGSVCTIYGCESHASTTLPLISKEAQLSELLNDLERRVETLEYKYLEVLRYIEHRYGYALSSVKLIIDRRGHY